MYLENVVFDAREPQRLGRFWEAALGCERLTDRPDGFETRLAVPGGPSLDLCFQRVPERPSEALRLHAELMGGPHVDQVVDRLLALGARRLDQGELDTAGVGLTDPEGNAFRVMADLPTFVDSGPLAALVLESADPDSDVQFWTWLTGWTSAVELAPRFLRHPSRRGPILELRPERVAKGATKNRRHLDVRLESGDAPDVVAEGIVERGGRELHPEWGELPWRLYADPSGNEFCVLPATTVTGIVRGA